MYRIIQPLNNNVALVKNSKGEQAVVMGLGVVFKKKKGDILSEQGIEKIFLLKSEESRENFMTLLKDVPLDFITVSYEIIDYGVRVYQFPVQEYIYVTLTDHIHCVYQMLQKKTYKVGNVPNMSEQYPIEYQIAEQALTIIDEKLGVEFPIEELSRIALHFINAKGVDIALADKEKHLKREIIDLVQKEFAKRGIRRTEKNHNFYDRLMIHFNYLLERIEQRNSEGNEFMISLERQIEKDYPESYQLADEICNLISHKLGATLDANERIYFALHFQRLLVDEK